MQLAVGKLGEVPVFRVTGEVDHRWADSLSAAVDEAVGKGADRLLFDLSSCTYLDSGGISVLLNALRLLPADGWLGVIEPHPFVLKLLEIVGFRSDPAFKVFGSEAEAEAASAALT